MIDRIIGKVVDKRSDHIVVQAGEWVMLFICRSSVSAEFL